MRISIFLLIALLVIALSCDQKKVDTAQKLDVAGAAEASISSSSKLKIYDHYDDMEYIFQYENDTTYVINFWATWCKPCVAELPYFDELYREYKNDKVRIILVSLDFPKQIDTKLIPFIEKNNVLPEVMLLKDGDVNTWIDKVSKEWDGAIPVTIVYNKDRRVFVSGEVDDYQELKSKVEPLVLR